MPKTRKTPQIADLERQHGKPIERIIAEAYTQHGTIDRAAASLKVNPKTYHGWLVRFRVQVKKVASVA